MASQQIVKSVTPIAITIAAGSTSNTQTVSVVAANSFIDWAGINAQGGNVVATTTWGSLVLTNSTTVTATRAVSDASNSLTLYGTLIEFAPGVIKSMQIGSATMTAATSNTATITSVTTGNSAVVYNGTTFSSIANDFSHNVFCKNVLTDSTTVTVSRQGNTGTVTVYFTVVEFNSGILNSSTQPTSINLSTIQLTNTATITSVSAANSMLLYSGQDMTTSGATWTQFDKDNSWVTITNGTTLTATRTAENSTSININSTVLEFKSNVVKSVNRGSIVIGASSNSNTATITSVNTSFTVVGYTGFTAADGSATTAVNVKQSAVILTNATTITAQTSANDATNTRTVGYDAVEFFPYSASTGNMFLCF